MIELLFPYIEGDYLRLLALPAELYPHIVPKKEALFCRIPAETGASRVGTVGIIAGGGGFVNTKILISRRGGSGGGGGGLAGKNMVQYTPRRGRRLDFSARLCYNVLCPKPPSGGGRTGEDVTIEN